MKWMFDGAKSLIKLPEWYTNLFLKIDRLNYLKNTII